MTPNAAWLDEPVNEITPTTGPASAVLSASAGSRGRRFRPALLVLLALAIITTATACTPSHMVDLVNKERRSRGIGQLIIDDHLTQVAQAWADHLASDPAGTLVHQDLASLNLGTAGENLALHLSVDKAHVALMNSPGHRANILSRSYHRVGVGIATIHGGRLDGYLIICEDFQG